MAFPKEVDVQRLVMVILMVWMAAPVVAQPDLALLSGGGRYDAVTINGIVLPVQDIQQLLAAGLLRLDPVTRRFALGAGVTSEAQFVTNLRQLPLTSPLAPRDLYRSSKVALPNGAAHALTVPSGFGPAHFHATDPKIALSASLGGVSRVPYTAQPDGALGFGLSFGNAFDGLGASVNMSFNDLTQLGNGQRISWGMAVSHYLSDGVSVSVGGENLFVGYTDGQASFYLTGSWAFDTRRTRMPFDGVLTLGAGNGRFADQTPRDIYEGKSARATAIFGSLAWQVAPQFNLISEWNGRNLNAGLGYTMTQTGVTMKLGVANLTGFSANGPILTGSVGMTLARF